MEPQKFGRYEIRAEVGRGGMATVYHAYDPRFEREVAIKVLPREMLHDPQFRTRFEREAKTIAMLEHPSIVPVYDFGEEDGQPYFVMRYMTGGSLSDRLRKGRLSIQEAANMFERLAPALDSAHLKGIIHRDLKPGNVLFDQYGEPYISDFGIAKLSEAQVSMTGSAIVGTPAYMSPEQAQGEKVDGRSDIYGLGVILFEMLTGQQPYTGDTPMSVVLKHVTEPVPHVLDLRPELPHAAEAVIEKAMCKDRDRRFGTVQALADALQAVARGETPDLESDAVTTQIGAKVEAAGRLPKGTDKTVLSPRPGKAQAGRKRGGAWAGLGIAALLVVGAGVAGLVMFRDKIPFLARPTQTRQADVTAASPQPGPTDTQRPQPPLDITDTPTLTPTARGPLAIGGADLIAFLNKNDLWLMGVDGSDLKQLTTDAAAKHDLDWAPDGKSLFYISGKCIQNLSLEGVVTTVTCFNVADFLEAFEISPDGTQVAISLNRVLFVVPFDLAAIGTARNWTHLQAMNGCFTYGPDSTGGAAAKRVRWSDDGKRLAVEIVGVAGGRQVDLIRVFNIATCSSAAPLSLDTFPRPPFTMTGYNTNPDIAYVDWDGETLFLLTSIFRFQTGYLYSYNLSSLRLEALDPLGTACCYSAPRWSPDGSQVLFAYQDINNANTPTRLYYVPFGTIGTGASYEPIDLPPEMLANPRDSTEAVLRPIK
jgi:serine/threonine-protein kinase